MAPYRPAAHSAHSQLPGSEYLPGAHMVWVGEEDPAGHAYPPAQLPMQEGVDRPVVDPKRPGSQGPLHEGLARPMVAPKRPGGQSVQIWAPWWA